MNHNIEGDGGDKESNVFSSQKVGEKDVAKTLVKNLAVKNVTLKPARSLDRNSEQLGKNTKNTQERDDENMMYEGTCKEVLEEGTKSCPLCDAVVDQRLLINHVQHFHCESKVKIR